VTLITLLEYENIRLVDGNILYNNALGGSS